MTCYLKLYTTCSKMLTISATIDKPSLFSAAQTLSSTNENSFNETPLHVKKKKKLGAKFKNGTITSNSATDTVQ